MKRVSQQGKTLSASQRRHLELQAKMRPQAAISLLQSSADFDKLRDTLNSRMFVGPPKPLHCFNMSDEADAASYWRMVEQYSQYGRAESSQAGTPSIAEWMGF
ncbi:hypothetical protein IFT47_20515 [Pseudomonas sp. CFBP 13711]|uniref:hypothetical protein n=1 Tax=unclassified Pseudomonas TaxID=196821 RepID=UPI00178441CE|nr:MULTISPECIES: hypothetical protein [unclassified Pseudomonas]MBD8709018.1 hypothetical protein [Pseudomonas sp. CFBP 13711]MBD8715059.1 hypothetical protein [Pseudomonas sp. CFBP 13715]